MQHRVGIAVLVIVMMTLLSGCLVEKKDVDKYSRTTDKLRIYEPRDYITYNVSAVTFTPPSSTTTTNGTLRIEYIEHGDLTRPVSGDNIPVIQEESILTFNNGGTSDTGTVRYISQDEDPMSPTYGQVTLHALEAPGIDEHYWLNNSNAIGNPTASYTVLESPLINNVSKSVGFYVWGGCAGICTDFAGQFSDNLNYVGDSTEVTTNLGIFVNPIQIDFTGTAIYNNPFSVAFDIRDICGTETTVHGYGGNGTMYIMPEIGIVRMSNTCRNVLTGEEVFYTITISDTNIDLP